jgi:hypothetical protein
VVDGSSERVQNCEFFKKKKRNIVVFIIHLEKTVQGTQLAENKDSVTLGRKE